MPMYKMMKYKNGGFSANLEGKIPWNVFFSLIGPYNICRKGNTPVIIKYITIVNHVTGW